MVPKNHALTILRLAAIRRSLRLQPVALKTSLRQKGFALRVVQGCNFRNSGQSDRSTGLISFFVWPVWEEHCTPTKCLSLAVLLPPGVGFNNLTTQVMEGGCHLEFTVRWHLCISDVTIPLQNWLSPRKGDHIEWYHPKFI